MLLTQSGVAAAYVREGYEFNREHQQRILDGLVGPGPDLDDIRLRLHWSGPAVGELVKSLWALICTDPKRASWYAAI